MAGAHEFKQPRIKGRRVIVDGYSLVKRGKDGKPVIGSGEPRKDIGRTTRSQLVMDVLQYIPLGRGILRMIKRNHINRMADAMLTGGGHTVESRTAHQMTKELLEKHPDATHVIIRRGKIPTQLPDSIVVEVPSPRSRTGRLAAKAYAKHGYSRHMSGEGRLILSREDVMGRPGV